jgi:hypothetical protein
VLAIYEYTTLCQKQTSFVPNGDRGISGMIASAAMKAG